MNIPPDEIEKKIKMLEAKDAYERERIRKQWLYTFAGQAMQGLMTQEGVTLSNVKDAVIVAKTLLEELEKEEKNP